jgi:predicted acylesterase/phospholipase RssA
MIDTLIISGGGLRGFGFIGALKILEESKIIKLKNIKYYYANSIGTVISLLLAIGYNTNFLDEFITKFDFKKVIPKIKISNLINNFFYKLGISDGNEIMTIIETLFLKKTKLEDINFIDFYKKYKIELNFITTNYTLGKEEILSHSTTPELSVLLAIRMSISIPIIFIPVSYNNNLYIDGFLVNNFPIDKIDINKNNYLALNISDEYVRNNPTIMEFIKGCMNISMYQINKNNIKIKNNKIININFGFVTESNLDNENINIINNIGKNYIIKYLNESNPFLENIKLFNHIENFTKKSINSVLSTLYMNIL